MILALHGQNIWMVCSIKQAVYSFNSLQVLLIVGLFPHNFTSQSFPPDKVDADTHTIMINAPAMPAGDNLSPNRKNAKHAVITGHSVCSRATERSEILVNARFCIR